MRAACAVLLLLSWLAAGCANSARPSAVVTGTTPLPAALVAEARPIGHGPRFHPPARGPVLGTCQPRLGTRFGAHIELFAQNRVLLVAAGIGTQPPLRLDEGRIASARCFGALVTVEPTGVVLVRPGARLTVADLFRSWGQPLSTRRVASFAAPAGTAVRVYVGGRQRRGAPGEVTLTPHAEIVLEVGPFVPPHRRYTFPPGT